MAKKLKVLLLAPHLRYGGSAQVTRRLASQLSRDQYEIHLALVTRPQPEELLFFAGVTIHLLGARRVRGSFLALLKLVRRLQPNVVFSGMAHLNLAVLLLRGLFPAQTAVILRQNAMVSATSASGDSSWMEQHLIPWLYPHADRVLCQTRAMADELVRVAGVPPRKLVVLANPVDSEAIRTAATQTEFHWRGPGPHLAAVGRLSPEKGFDLLLAAMAELRQHFPHAELAIAGSGRLEAALKQQSASLGLAEGVRFLGQLDSPYALLAGATAYVLPSRRDAMPNALLEAAALGLPLIATPASQGLVELLRDQPGVWLASACSSAALAATLLQVLPTLRPAERFAHDFLQHFGIDRAIQAYERVIDEVSKERLP